MTCCKLPRFWLRRFNNTEHPFVCKHGRRYMTRDANYSGSPMWYWILLDCGDAS